MKQKTRVWILLAGLTAMVTASPSTAGIDAPVRPPIRLAAESAAADSANVQLARHLRDTGAQMFGAFWCPHCRHQKERFGEEAFRAIDYIECDPRGENPQPQLCQAEGIQGYPTWKIDGRLYPGDRSLDELAELSGYSGSRNFTPSDEP